MGREHFAVWVQSTLSEHICVKLHTHQLGLCNRQPYKVALQWHRSES